MADRRPLISESSDLSDTAHNSPALPSLGFSPSSSSLGLHAQVSPPTSPPVSRPAYSRLQSDTTAVGRNTPSTVLEEDEEDIADSFTQRGTTGLGIAGDSSSRPGTSRRVSIQTIPRRPVSVGLKSPPIKSPGTLSPPGTGDPFLSGFPHSAESTPDLRRERFSPKDDGGEYEDYRRGVLKNASRSSTSLNNDYQQYLHSSDTERLRPRGAPSIKSAYESNFRPTEECPTARDFYQSRFTWLSITIMILCVFSTVFSGIFLGLALRAPRYGRKITSQGSFKPADAILLTSIMAKLIELSFVTSFVAFLGQVLSRRAFMKAQGRGVTLSELSMWRWVVQPGTLLTHWETMKYAGISVLGILSLLSAILATSYAPASTALVQPMLKDGGKWDRRVLAGRVKSSFANVNYVGTICETPITTTIDKLYAANTCLQIEHAGQGYHNYQRYLSYWKTASANGNGTSDQHQRPPGFGLLHENTTVTAQWINVIDTKETSKKYGRAINNVSLAMPHSGVFAAARDGRNDILQPEELNSEGTYSLRASVPSPVMHVLCANVNKTELEPIVYDLWPNNDTVNINTWLPPSGPRLADNATTTNKTVVDDIFGWTKQDKEKMTDYPPVFSKLPIEFNTIMNHTSASWGRNAIYLLGAGGVMDDGTNLNGTYALCKIDVTLTSSCSTQHNATGSGGTMEALCEGKDEEMAYIKSNSSAVEDMRVDDWRDVGFDWANSMSLNTGIMDGAASNSRLLTQLILPPNAKGEYDLSPALPSPAEALAVMAGCTLLMSALDTPYVMFWNYSRTLLDEYQTQYFNASVKAQQYASGGVDEASKAWMLVLFLVFLMNIFVLAYFLFHKGLVTDFSEPPNLFALAVNSPPSHLFAGSCGGGPEGKQYVVNWFVNTEGDHLYMEPGQKPVLIHDHAQHGQRGQPHVHVHGPEGTKASGAGMFGGVTRAFSRLRERGLHFGRKQDLTRLRPASIVETDLELEDGPMRTERQRQYAKLAKRRSML